jgi:ferredoxin
MKVHVRIEACCGHARCAVVAPDLFVLNEVGYLDTPEIDVPDGEEGLAKRAVRACPEGCLSIGEEKS